MYFSVRLKIRKKKIALSGVQITDLNFSKIMASSVTYCAIESAESWELLKLDYWLSQQFQITTFDTVL